MGGFGLSLLVHLKSWNPVVQSWWSRSLSFKVSESFSVTITFLHIGAAVQFDGCLIWSPRHFASWLGILPRILLSLSTAAHSRVLRAMPASWPAPPLSPATGPMKTKRRSRGGRCWLDRCVADLVLPVVARRESDSRCWRGDCYCVSVLSLFWIFVKFGYSAWIWKRYRILLN